MSKNQNQVKMNVTEIKERIKTLEQVIGSVEFAVKSLASEIKQHLLIERIVNEPKEQIGLEEQVREDAYKLIAQAYKLIDIADSNQFKYVEDEFGEQLRELGRLHREKQNQ